jgi:NitT/TauT family transport system substrate-binding protein
MFHDGNPGVVKAFLSAAREAERFISEHPREACEMYVVATGEKAPLEDLVAMIKQPDMFYNMTPVGTMATALHMSDIKVLKTRPASWKDFFFTDAHDLPGN